jgi:hypothetical protein
MSHFLQLIMMASTCSMSSPGKGIRLGNLEFTVTNDGKPRPTTSTPTGDDTPQLTPDQQPPPQHQQANHM